MRVRNLSYDHWETLDNIESALKFGTPLAYKISDRLKGKKFAVLVGYGIGEWATSIYVSPAQSELLMREKGDELLRLRGYLPVYCCAMVHYEDFDSLELPDGCPKIRGDE